MKLPSVYTDLCFKQGFEICHGRQQLTLPLGCEEREVRVAASVGVSGLAGSRSRRATFDAWFTGGRLRKLKTSITPLPLRIGPIFDINDFDHKDLRNLLLQ